MISVKSVLVLGLFAVSSLLFQNFIEIDETSLRNDGLDLPTEDFSPSDHTGKLVDAAKLPDIYSPSSWEQLGFPEINDELAIALQHQLHVLENGKFRDGKSVGGLGLTYQGMEEVIKILLDRTGGKPTDLHNYLDANQIWGKDQAGSVFFTGYFTPVLKVKKQKTAKYSHPIYAYPSNWNGSLPSRAEIDGQGALEGMGLELAYASNPMDVYAMQMQGSGYIEFLDSGERYLFRFAGDNRRNFRNIQHYFRKRPELGVTNLSFKNIHNYLLKHPEMQDSVLFTDPSYTFFAAQRGLVKGAGDVPLMTSISIAADPVYFPAGSVILAAFPVTDRKGHVTHHEYRILLPQDVGGAVKGAGHVDVYCGVGEAGRKRASALHHYGRMWLLTPKSINEQMAQRLDLEATEPGQG